MNTGNNDTTDKTTEKKMDAKPSALKTSYYGNKGLTNDDHLLVCISLGKPKFPTSYEIEDEVFILKPKRDMLDLPYGMYVAAYRRQLDGHGIEKIKKVLGSMHKKKARGRPIVLLCFEDIRKENQWCHRRIFAEWWEEQTSRPVEELEPANPPSGQKKKDTRQLALI